MRALARESARAESPRLPAADSRAGEGLSPLDAGDAERCRGRRIRLSRGEGGEGRVRRGYTVCAQRAEECGHPSSLVAQKQRRFTAQPIFFMRPHGGSLILILLAAGARGEGLVGRCGAQRAGDCRKSRSRRQARVTRQASVATSQTASWRQGFSLLSVFTMKVPRVPCSGRGHQAYAPEGRARPTFHFIMVRKKVPRNREVLLASLRSRVDCRPTDIAAWTCRACQLQIPSMALRR